MDKIDVIMPSGGKVDDHFARVALTPYKSLMKCNDSMVGLKTLDAILGCGFANRVVLVGPKEVQDVFAPRVTSVINDSGNLTRNIANGIRELKQMGGISSKVLVVTTDLPYLEANTLRTFIETAPSGFDIVAPLVEHAQYLNRFPSAPGTFAKLKDGNWTLGCAYLVDPDKFIHISSEIDKMTQNRKSIFKMAGLLGFGFLFKVLTKKITVPEIAEKVESIIKCKVTVTKGPFSELAFDIDDLKDYEYALRYK